MKRRFKKRSELEENMSLQITSMADIFTILLVFLLKTFSTSAANISPANNISLPEAKVDEKISDTLKLEIFSNGVLLDDRQVTALNGFQFEHNDLESNGTPRSLNASLIREMEKEKNRRSKRTQSGSTAGEGQPSPSLMVIADQKTPYSTLRTILGSASNIGYVDFKLLLLRKENQ